MMSIAVKKCLRMDTRCLAAWLDSIRLRNVLDSASCVGCVEPDVTPFEESTGDGDDEPDVHMSSRGIHFHA